MVQCKLSLNPFTLYIQINLQFKKVVNVRASVIQAIVLLLYLH